MQKIMINVLIIWRVFQLAVAKANFIVKTYKSDIRNIVKPVYKGHPRKPENVPFMSSFPLYTSYNYMHYSLMEYRGCFFIDNDLLYRGAL